jgi:hypothetical protein
VFFEGTGRTVTGAFTPPLGINRVILAHTGQRNFVVKVYHPSGKEDFLVNVTGPFQGTRPLRGSSGEWYLEIKADAPWSVRIEPMPIDESAGQGVEGSGDFTSGLFTPVKVGPVPYFVSHTGTGKFKVQLVCAGGQRVVQNESGPIHGPAIANFAQGPCLWNVTADGDWQIKPRP